MTQRGLDASWRGNSHNGAGILGVPLFHLGIEQWSVSATTPLAAPPIAWTSTAQARSERNTAPNATRREASFSNFASTVLLICQVHSYFTNAKFLSLDVVCPLALASLLLTANGRESLLVDQAVFDTFRHRSTACRHYALCRVHVDDKACFPYPLDHG